MANSIVEIARETIGSPFHHQGRVVGVGIDCVGVLVHVFERLGLPYFDVKGYPRESTGSYLMDVLDKQPSLMATKDLKEGDLLLFAFSKFPQHVGVYTGTSIIHARYQHKKVVEHNFDRTWQRIHKKTYRVTGNIA